MLNEMLPEIESDLDSFKKYLTAQLECSPLTDSLKESSNKTKNKILKSFESFKAEGEIKQNKVVGLIEGVFDMAHFGHFNAIRQASLVVDELIVGINADESVLKCKG